MNFIQIKDLSVNKGENIEFELYFWQEFMSNRMISQLNATLSSYHTLTLPSQIFTGETSEVGIFQGSGLDLYKTYRSSYINIMNSNINEQFDP